MTNSIKLTAKDKSEIVSSISAHPYFAPAFTKIEFMEDNYGDERPVITRNWFKVMEKRAKEIMTQHNIKANLSDDDTAADFFAKYEENIALIFQDYPGLTFHNLQDGC
jgi:hypothetical protein